MCGEVWWRVDTVRLALSGLGENRPVEETVADRPKVCRQRALRASHYLPDLLHCSTEAKIDLSGDAGFPEISNGVVRVIRSGREDRAASVALSRNASRRDRGIAAAWEKLSGSAGYGIRLGFGDHRAILHTGF